MSVLLCDWLSKHFVFPVVAERFSAPLQLSTTPVAHLASTVYGCSGRGSADKSSLALDIININLNYKY